MRVKELADLTGTTVRTIRYYHQIGLLPVPEQHGGVRDYGMAQLARLVRVRWLVGSGVPLAAVRTMLEESASDPDERDAIQTDLALTLSGVDDRIAELERQRKQLINLLHTTAQGGPVSPMPGAVRAMYDRLLARVADEEVADVIRAERQVVEFACYRTELPPLIVEIAENLTDDQLDLIIPLFAEFRDLNESIGALSVDELHCRVDEMADHAAEFVASLGFEPDQVLALLQEASLGSKEYVEYATTQLFAEPLQERFQARLTWGLRRRGALPGPDGATA
ncbi:MerR family transcriptional regulator [Flexivirga caeni]|uniref:MerR family transcriptional regulator n=1 Tax=Flexivirga caeni TaxID=2294115 RepID=A0A3M9MGW2_9MICO|nr:MerR family transcriptional regulator [Flexivirga caeni]RNI23898.1 MerR family transcriptional regulator [Flexivirga caeni]